MITLTLKQKLRFLKWYLGAKITALFSRSFACQRHNVSCVSYVNDIRLYEISSLKLSALEATIASKKGIFISEEYSVQEAVQKFLNDIVSYSTALLP
jgi:hypothetical protein